MSPTFKIIFLWCALVAAGCSSAEPPLPSRFVQTVNLEAIAKSAAGNGVTINPEYVADETADREQGQATGAQTQIAISFQCEPDALDEFANAVVKELRGHVVSDGGKTVAAEPTDHDWSTKPFMFDYEDGAATGTIRVSIGESSDAEYPHELTIKVDESVTD